ncbi:MAG: thioredoxin domain-containing protein, partial [Desulfobulbaceae bacterium]
MKKIAAVLALSLLSSPVLAQPTQPAPATPVETSVAASWKLDAKPLDMVHSLDNKRVFILGDDNKVYIYANDGGKLGTIPVDKGVTAIDIAPRGEMLYLMNGQDNTFTSLSVSFTTTIDVTGAPFLGKENAPVVLALFSDFQCPYCSKIQPLLDQMLEKNPETVKIAFKNLPLTNIHNMAEPAALAALAAHNQGKFWQMHDALFAMNSELSAEKIQAAAKEIGLDMTKFNADLNSEANKQRLIKDMTDARQAEVSGTPSLFINGRRVNDRSPEAMQKMIDEEVAKAKKG